MEAPISIAQATLEAKGVIVWSENDAKLQNQKFLFCCLLVDEGGASCFVSVFFETSIFFVSFLKVFCPIFQMPSATFKLPQNQPNPKSYARCHAGEADSQPKPSGLSIFLMD